MTFKFDLHTDDLQPAILALVENDANLNALLAYLKEDDRWNRIVPLQLAQNLGTIHRALVLYLLKQRNTQRMVTLSWYFGQLVGVFGQDHSIVAYTEVLDSLLGDARAEIGENRVEKLLADDHVFATLRAFPPVGEPFKYEILWSDSEKTGHLEQNMFNRLELYGLIVRSFEQDGTPEFELTALGQYYQKHRPTA